MDASLTIIDNFYDEPDHVRDIALSCEYYPEKVSKGFPNGNAPWSGKMSKDAYSPAWIDAVVSNHLHKNLRQMISSIMQVSCIFLKTKNQHQERYSISKTQLG